MPAAALARGRGTLDPKPPRDAKRPRAALGVRRAKAARAVAETLFATDDGQRLEWLVNELDSYLAHSGPRAKLLLLVGLFATSVLGPLLALRFPPFRAHGAASRGKILERVERSFVSLPFLALKALLCVIWFEHPASLAHTGYDDRCKDDP